MFKGAFRAFKEINNAVSRIDNPWISEDDLSEKSAGQSSGNSAFIDKDIQEQGTSNILLPNFPPQSYNLGIHPPSNELTTVDSTGARAGEWFGSNIVEESQYPTEEDVVITPSFLIPKADLSLSLNQEEIKVDDREQEEGVPASSIPTDPSALAKSIVDSFFSPTPTKPSTHGKSASDVWPSPRATKSIVDPLSSPTPIKPSAHGKSLSDAWLSPRATDHGEHRSMDMKSSSKPTPPTNLTFTQSNSTTDSSESDFFMESNPLDLNFSIPKPDPPKPAPKMQFKGFANGVAQFRTETPSTSNDSSSQHTHNVFQKDRPVKKMPSTPSFLKKMALPKAESHSQSSSTPSASLPVTNAAKDVPSDPNPAGNIEQESSYHSPPPLQEHEETETIRRRRKQNNPFAMLQPIVESTTLTPEPTASPSSFGSGLYGVDSSFAKRMEEVGRLRRLQSQRQLNSQADDTPTTPVAKSPKHSKSSSETTPSSSGSAINIPSEYKVVVPPTPPKTPAKVSPAVSRSEQDSHAAELKTLHDKLNNAMREIHILEKEVARVTMQSSSDKERLASELRSAMQDNSALVGRADQLKRRNDDLTSELTRAQAEVRKVTTEKRGWQAQLDTMHHKAVRAERQIRCLDHLTRAKLEAREEAVYGLTKRTKLALTQRRSSEEVIRAIVDLNEEILQTANLLIENLDRTRFYGSITESSNKAQKVVGAHVTEMLKTQSDSSASGFRQLLMLVVMEMFLVHWCIAIMEGFYPKRPSFADLLVELSSHTTTTTAGEFYPNGLSYFIDL